MPCGVCSKPADLKCSNCDKVSYCSKEHQKEHWEIHKNVCIPFKVKEDERVGRHLVARCLIKKGEVILKETPLVCGPPQITGPVCLTCYVPLEAETAVPCVSCGWPLCSQQCASSCTDHHPECTWAETKRKAKVKISQFVTPHPTYACLLPLRCLFLKSSNPTLWERLLSLESHKAEREANRKQDSDRFGIAMLLHRFYKLENDFSEEEILNICGIIQINGHEVPLSGGGYVSIYWQGSFIEHSCVASCSKTFDDKGRLLLRAAVDLDPESRLSICYTDPLWSTPMRRQHLSQTKFFWCKCPRCSDPTEFGTYISAINCTLHGECGGKMLPPTFLTESSQKAPDWVCNICGHSTDEAGVAAVLAKVCKMAAKVNKEEIRSIITFLAAAELFVPENHYMMIDMQIALVQLYGQVNSGGLQTIEEEYLNHKESLCKKLVRLTEKLIPAECRLRGSLLFELHATVAERTRRHAQVGLIDVSQVHGLLLESKSYLETALDLLQYEPEALPEGKMAIQAEENLKDLENVLRGIHMTLGDSPI